MRKQLKAADSALTYYAMSDKLSGMCSADWDDDRAAFKWLTEGGKPDIKKAVAEVKAAAVKRNVAVMLEGLPAEQRAAIISGLA